MSEAGDNIHRLNVLATRADASAQHLKSGNGGGTFDGMEARVSRLEAQFEYVQRDLGEIKADNKTIINRLAELPTRRDLHTYALTGIAIGLAVIAIVVGGIIGGLSWIKL